jgi:hypothetical protein
MNLQILKLLGAKFLGAAFGTATGKARKVHFDVRIVARIGQVDQRRPRKRNAVQGIAESILTGSGHGGLTWISSQDASVFLVSSFAREGNAKLPLTAVRRKLLQTKFLGPPVSIPRRIPIEGLRVTPTKNIGNFGGNRGNSLVHGALGYHQERAERWQNQSRTGTHPKKVHAQGFDAAAYRDQGSCNIQGINHPMDDYGFLRLARGTAKADLLQANFLFRFVSHHLGYQGGIAEEVRSTRV